MVDGFYQAHIGCMISLAMDTAGTACAACLYDSSNGRILAEISEEIGRGHAERLMGIISDVLAKAKVSYNDIGKIVTTVGPGSFTGIRVGVATARGFGLGLGIPVVGVTNLEAVMEEVREQELVKDGQPLVVVMEAGRGQVYVQCSFDTEFGAANTPFIAPVEELALAIDQLNIAESGSPVLSGNCASQLSSLLKCDSTIAEASGAPHIRVIAHIGAGRPEAASKPEPLYLRKADAKPQDGFAVERKA